jgi:hypothetical protein
MHFRQAISPLFLEAWPLFAMAIAGMTAYPDCLAAAALRASEEGIKFQRDRPPVAIFASQTATVESPQHSSHNDAIVPDMAGGHKEYARRAQSLFTMIKPAIVGRNTIAHQQRLLLASSQRSHETSATIVTAAASASEAVVRLQRLLL